MLKTWLIFNLAIALVLGTVQTIQAPLVPTYGPFNYAIRYPMIRVETTNAGCHTEMVWTWREVAP